MVAPAIRITSPDAASGVIILPTRSKPGRTNPTAPVTLSLAELHAFGSSWSWEAGGSPCSRFTMASNRSLADRHRGQVYFMFFVRTNCDGGGWQSMRNRLPAVQVTDRKALPSGPLIPGTE